MQTATEIVQSLNSVQVVSLLKRLNQLVFGAVPYKDLHDHLPAGNDSVQLLEHLDVEARKKTLPPQLSVELAEQVLMEFAQDEALAPVLVRAWEDIKSDDSLFVETIVALGLIANLTLFMATTQMEFKVGNLIVKKGQASLGLVSAVMNPLKLALKAKAAV